MQQKEEGTLKKAEESTPPGTKIIVPNLAREKSKGYKLQKPSQKEYLEGIVKVDFSSSFKWQGQVPHRPIRHKGGKKAQAETSQMAEDRHVTHEELDAKLEAMQERMERHSERVENSVGRMEQSMEHHSTRVEKAVGDVSNIANNIKNDNESTHESIKSDNRNTRNMVLGAVTLAVILFALFINSERSWIQRSIDNIKTEVQSLKNDSNTTEDSSQAGDK